MTDRRWGEPPIDDNGCRAMRKQSRRWPRIGGMPPPRMPLVRRCLWTLLLVRPSALASPCVPRWPNLHLNVGCNELDVHTWWLCVTSIDGPRELAVMSPRNSIEQPVAIECDCCLGHRWRFAPASVGGLPPPPHPPPPGPQPPSCWRQTQRLRGTS